MPFSASQVLRLVLCALGFAPSIAGAALDSATGFRCGGYFRPGVAVEGYSLEPGAEGEFALYKFSFPDGARSLLLDGLECQVSRSDGAVPFIALCQKPVEGSYLPQTVEFYRERTAKFFGDEEPDEVDAEVIVASGPLSFRYTVGRAFCQAL